MNLVAVLSDDRARERLLALQIVAIDAPHEAEVQEADLAVGTQQVVARMRVARGDPHPGNYLLCPDGRVCFLDFGLIRRVDRDYLEGEQALARAVVDGDAAAAAEVAGRHFTLSENMIRDLVARVRQDEAAR